MKFLALKNDASTLAFIPAPHLAILSLGSTREENLQSSLARSSVARVRFVNQIAWHLSRLVLSPHLEAQLSNTSTAYLRHAYIGMSSTYIVISTPGTLDTS